MRRVVALGFLGAAALVLASIAGAAKDRKPPSAPRIAGPSKTAATSPTFVFTSHDDTTPAAKLRYRCAFDGTKFHPCKSRYTESLTVNAHQLFAQAVDLAGNRSKVSSFSVTISAPPPPPEHPDIAKARAATDRYHDVNAAMADGYVDGGGGCIGSTLGVGVPL